MVRLLLDTTVLIDVLRGRPAARRVREEAAGAEWPYVCAVNVEEVVRGLRVHEIDGARRLFASLRVAPLGDREGWQAGEWRRDYAERGITLTQADCLIAAAAHALGARLCTGNPRHFPMQELRVEHWPPGV